MEVSMDSHVPEHGFHVPGRGFHVPEHGIHVLEHGNEWTPPSRRRPGIVPMQKRNELQRFAMILEAPERVVLDRPGIMLGSSWSVLGSSWSPPGSSWDRLGVVLDRPGIALGPPGGRPGIVPMQKRNEFQ